MRNRSYRKAVFNSLRLIVSGTFLFGASICLSYAFADDIGPQDVVVNTTEKVLTVLRKEHDVIKKDPGRLSSIINDIILPNVDIERMSRWVLGKYWRKAGTEQRADFIREFRNLLVRTYATALYEYTNEEIEYLPLRAEVKVDEDVTVQTMITQHGGPSIPVNFSLHYNGGGWKVYDLKINGISLISNYRSTYATAIRRDGLDKLISDLAERNKEKKTK